jgi:cytochrome c-type biogenesis protein CcmI
MVVFFLTIFLIALLVSLIIFYFLKKSTKYVSITAVNKNIFNQQFSEINQDFKLGVINKNEFDIMKKELAQRVLKYSSNNNLNEKREIKVWANFIKIFSVPLIIIVSMVIYNYNGQPGLPDFPLSLRKENNIPDIFYKRALIDIDKQISKFKRNIDLYILKANTFSALKNNDKALSVWKYIINNFEEELDAEIMLSYGESIVQSSLNEENRIIIVDKAKEVFEQAAKLSYINTEIGALSRFYIGLYEYQNDNIPLANSIWTSIIKSAPANAPWKKQLELQVEQLSKKQIALQNQEIKSMVERLAERLYSTDSKDISEWQKLGRSYLVIEQFEEAAKAYRKAYDLDIKNLVSSKGLAESMLLNQNNNASIDDNIINLFKKILKEEENYPLALWVIAEHEIKLNNYDRAKILLNRVLIQLSEGTEEYNLVLRKLKELNK